LLKTGKQTPQREPHVEIPRMLYVNEDVCGGPLGIWILDLRLRRLALIKKCPKDWCLSGTDPIRIHTYYYLVYGQFGLEV